MTGGGHCVWAKHTSVEARFPNDYSSGWNHSLEFSSLADLNRQFDDLDLNGKIIRIGIVAHGNTPGTVLLDRALTPQTITSFGGDLNRMRWFLRRDESAILAFFSCISGAGTNGTRLLCALSRRVPGRKVIGFTLHGRVGRGALATRPGDVELVSGGLNTAGSAAERPANMWGPFAKWAKNGAVVRSPRFDFDEAPEFHGR